MKGRLFSLMYSLCGSFDVFVSFGVLFLGDVKTELEVKHEKLVE